MALTEAFLSGQILTPLSIIETWLPVLQTVTPLTTGELNTQFTEELEDLTDLLDESPNPTLNVDLILVPISLVNNIKVSFETLIYQENDILVRNSVQDTIDTVNSVFDNYSSQFYVTSMPPNDYYIY